MSNAYAFVPPASGTLAVLNDTVTVAPGGAASVTFVISAVAAAVGTTVVWEGLLDGVWCLLSAHASNATSQATKVASLAATTVNNVAYIIPCFNYEAVRVRLSAVTSGSLTVSLRAAPTAL